MRTLVIVGLVVGPVLVLGVPLALSSDVTVPPSWTAAGAPGAVGAFVLAGVAAVAGTALLLLSFRGRRATLPAEAPTSLPAPAEAAQPPVAPPAAERPAVVVPTVVPRRSGPRYVATEATAGPIGARSRYVTLRTRRTTVATTVSSSGRSGVTAG